MHSFSCSLLTIAFIYINIPPTTPQTTSNTTSTTSSTASTPTNNNENTHLYVIIGILSSIIILMICAAIIFFYRKNKKANNKISFAIKTIAENIDNPTDKIPQTDNQSITPTPKTTPQMAQNLIKPALNTKKVSFDTIDNQKKFPNRQIHPVQQSFPNYAPNLQQNNFSTSSTHSINKHLQNKDQKAAQSSAASKNFIQFLNSSVSQRNLTSTDPCTSANTAANTAANSVQQNIYLQEQRAAFARMRIASSPNLNVQSNNNSLQKNAPPIINRAMFCSQQNLNFATPQLQNVNAQQRMMQARRAQSVRDLTGNVAQNSYPQQFHGQAAYGNFGVQNSNVNAQQRMMQAQRAQSVRDLTGNVAQNCYPQQQGYGYDRSRAMTNPDPQNKNSNYQQNAVQNVQNVQQNELENNVEESSSSSSGSSSIRTGTESDDDGIDSDDVEMQQMWENGRDVVLEVND